MKLPAFIVDRLAAAASAYISQTPPGESIGPDGAPYMLRWFLIPKNRFLGIYLHLFLNSDDDRALHDHPWHTVSFVVTGNMWEVYAKRGTDPRDIDQQSTRHIERRDIVWRQAGWSHRIVMESGVTSITLFVAGPRVREWGFWCPNGWKHWREYCAQHDRGQVGQGCD